MKIRKASFAGKFYPSDKIQISKLLDKIVSTEKSKIDYSLTDKKMFGAVVPHAGYIYSAYQAIHFFELLKNSKEHYDTFVIIHPNHTGYGSLIGLDVNQEWETPYGSVPVDQSFYEYLNFPVSELAHKYEHSGEVIIPMLQHFLNYPFSILPICLSQQNQENAQNIAKAIYEANKQLNKKIMIIASSDFSHYVDPKEGERLDNYVISQILLLNSDMVFKEVRSKNISVCGFGPIMTLIDYSKLVSTHPKAKILRRGHSGEIHASNEVVDYVSILVYEE
jgi:AmmeMemoRadiSam system protein B